MNKGGFDCTLYLPADGIAPPRQLFLEWHVSDIGGTDIAHWYGGEVINDSNKHYRGTLCGMKGTPVYSARSFDTQCKQCLAYIDDIDMHKEIIVSPEFFECVFALIQARQEPDEGVA